MMIALTAALAARLASKHAKNEVARHLAAALVALQTEECSGDVAGPVCDAFDALEFDDEVLTNIVAAIREAA